jgi:hypothetical protein
MYRCIGHQFVSSAVIRQRLIEAPLVAIRELLTNEQILAACTSCGYHFRERLFGPVVTVLQFVAQALQREESFAATWEEMLTPVMAEFPELASQFDRSSLTHARKRLPQEVLECLARQACGQPAGTRSWRGYRLRAIDVTTVSMPREATLFAHFGAHRARTTTVRYPLGTFACLLDLEESSMVDYRFGAFDPGEMNTALPLLQHLGAGDLLLADRHYAGSPFLARLLATGADFLVRKNARRRIDRLSVIKRLGRHDFITELPMAEQARREDPTLPAVVRVRVFKASWKTPAGERVTEWFMTSLEDPGKYKKRTLAKLYHQRWQAETVYQEFKCTLHADVLRSKTVDNIYKEIAAHVLAYQIVRRIIHEAAERRGAKCTEISFINTVRWVVHFSHHMASLPADRLRPAYEAMLDAVAACEVDVRPGRLEPRALTREWKHYPHLRSSRQEWRKKRLKNVA